MRVTGLMLRTRRLSFGGCLAFGGYLAFLRKLRSHLGFHMDWLRLIRWSTQYVVPALVVAVAIVEIAGWLFGVPLFLSGTYNYVLLVVFSVLTAMMIGLCGWVIWRWDLDRLFFRLEGQIDSRIASESGPDEDRNGGTLLDRASELLLGKVIKGRSVIWVKAIERSYWDDINAGGALAFPRPDVAAAVSQIEKSRHDLQASLADMVSRTMPLGGISAPIVSRLIFKSLAPQIKVRLCRRLLLRFLSQLGILFILSAICFYISILAWSRVSEAVLLSQSAVSPTSVALYQLDLILRGALFDFMEHTRWSISPIAVNRNATTFLCYTLMFRMFVAIYVMSSLFRVLRFVLQRWRVLFR
jgi:hypothetical protein